MSVSLVSLSSFRIDDANPLKRDIPRKAEHQLNGYVDKFDFKYLFFDLYEVPGGVEFNGPPMFNFKDHLPAQVFFSQGEALPSPQHTSFWKVDRTLIEVDKAVQSVQMDNALGSFDLAVQKSELDTFSGRRVIFTLSKNNDLEWIRDWAKFYSRIHGIDAILFYDNGSDRYTLEQIADVLGSVPGIKEVRVIGWPFPYGPRGGAGIKWDSDFTQYCMIEHARRRFFAKAAAVTYADVDELVVCEDGLSLTYHLNASTKSAITYAGVWVETAAKSPVTEKRFWNYAYNDLRRAPCTRKWTIRPSAIPEECQIHVHAFGGGVEADFVPTIRHRHFKGINFDWKNTRTTSVNLVPEFHRFDAVWAQVAIKAFNEEGATEALSKFDEFSTQATQKTSDEAQTLMEDMERKFEQRRVQNMPWIRKGASDKRQVVWQAVLTKNAGAVFDDNVFISEEANVFTVALKVGKNSWIASNALVRGDATIGENSTVNVGVQIAGKVRIGNGVRIGAGSAIIGFNHGTENGKAIWRQKSSAKGIRIGDDVWIGANVTIVDGVTVGPHSIIGAGAIVTKSVPAHSRVLGVPSQRVDDRRQPAGEAKIPN